MRGEIADSNFCDIDVVRGQVNVHEDRLGPHQADHLRGADPRERNRDDLVAGPDLQGPQRDFQAVGAAGNGEAVLDSDIPGESLFQFGHLWPHDEVRTLDHLADPLVDFRLVFAVLLFQINEFHAAAFLSTEESTGSGLIDCRRHGVWYIIRHLLNR